MPPTGSIEQAHLMVLDALQGIRRKAKALSVLFGVGVVLAATVGLVLGVVLLDYLLNLPKWPRLFFMALAAGGIVYVVWTYVVRVVLAKLSLSDVAGRLEGAFPEFEDRLRSTIDFVRGEVPGSAAMKDRVVGEAEKLAAQVNLSGALVAKPALSSMAAGVGAVLLAALLVLSQTDLARIAWSRLMLERGASWPKKVQINVLKGVPVKVASGQRVDVRMRLAKGDKAGMAAIVYAKYDNGRTQEQLMTRNADGTYSATVDARGNVMSVWMKAGDDQTEPQQVNVVQRLAIRSVNLKVTPPAYAKLEPMTVNLGETPAQVTAGSGLELQVAFNKPLAQDKPIVMEPVNPEAKAPGIAWTAASAASAVGRWVAGESLRFRLRAMDNDYFENPGLEEYEVIVRPDQMPSVIIENPSRNEDRTPVAVVKLEAMVEDDFDISSMVLIVDRKADNKHWEIPLSSWYRVDSHGERRRFRVKHEWELSKLPGADLKPGDVLEYFVRVRDNYNINGAMHDPVDSGRLKINIISEETLGLQVTDAIRAVAEKVRQMQNNQNRNLQETQNLGQEMAKKQRLDAGDKTTLARLADQQGGIASQTKQLAGQMAALERRLEENRSTNQELKEIAKDVRSTLNDAAERPMSEASRKLSEAGQPGDPKADAKQQTEQRGKAVDASSGMQQQASEELGKALKKMGNLGVFERLLQEIRNSLKEQQDLSKQLSDLSRQTIGKRVEQLTAEQKKQLEAIAEAQRQASEKTDKLTKELAKAAEQMQKSDPAASQAMQQAAQQSQAQQVSPNQSQAAQNAQQNQQAQAQAKQKQAELGLQMMLDTLREAERRKLEHLAKELAKLRELVAMLIRRQAGHNIDNLRLQDKPDALKLITDELMGKADRMKDKMPPKPDNAQLSRSQIQTERNTRDVSKTAEEMQKGGTEIAGLLIKAAGMMERAIVGIRDANLPEAYDPSQVGALATLEDAMRKAEEAAAEVQKQAEEANRETIRQAYEKIKGEQEKINAETVRIDKSQRLPDGTFRREDAVKLGRLPGEQGGLADRIKALEEDLSKLGGLVYVWANQDIAKSMSSVKDDLGKQQTGKATQAEETRIVEQLDAMIRSLATSPVVSDFHQEGGGAGGSGGAAAKRKLPTEAELKLLKELQIAINKSTKVIDSQPEKDKERLLSMGNRQGELRGLLDQLLQKASNGEIKLDPEPDAKDRLPEEAGEAEVENQELDEWLRGAKASDDQVTDDVKRVGQRMGRSRQRLAQDNDPGKVTQIIQERILNNLDNLIQLSRQQMAQGKPGSGQGQGEQAMKPKPEGQAQQEGTPQPNQGSTPAGAERVTQGGDNRADPSKDIRENAAEWGHLTPRERQAVIEGTQDTIISKYKRIIDDYYEMMGKKGAERK